MIPYAAGGSGDQIGRPWVDKISVRLGPAFVENIGGAGGAIGTAEVARQQPDGYSLLLGNGSTQVIIPLTSANPGYSAGDFRAIYRLISTALVFAVHPSVPAHNLQELIAYARANQAAMHYGSGGIGSPNHLACALFNAAVGINVTHVPYRGFGPMIEDLVAGRIDYLCSSITAAVGYIESRQVKAIALLSKDRSPLLPAYPSAGEQGLADFEDTGWSGMFLPEGSPPPIVRKLNAAVVAALDTPDVQARFRQAGAEIVAPDRRSPEYLQKFVGAEIRKWAAVIKSAGIATH